MPCTRGISLKSFINAGNMHSSENQNKIALAVNSLKKQMTFSGSHISLCNVEDVPHTHILPSELEFAECYLHLLQNSLLKSEFHEKKILPQRNSQIKP